MPQARVLIYGLDGGDEDDPGKRGPNHHLVAGNVRFDNPIAIIWDPGDMGVGDWVNTPGQVFFTLPVEHPQIDLIEPMQVHYRVEVKRDGVWEALDDNTDGLIYDMQAGPDEVVFRGMNYVGLLNRTFEQRFKPKLGPDVPISKGGSKYVKKTIDYVVKDQLKVEAALTSSPVGFIHAPALPGWSEKITIYSVFQQRLEFIAGMMESHVADTNRRPRLRVVRNSNPNQTELSYDEDNDDEFYQWVFDDVPGTKVDDLKLEYGGMINGFQVVPFGPTWATKGLGVGRTQTGTLPLYATSVPKMEGGGNFPTWDWGSFPVARVFPDIIDANDLKRRTARMVRRAGQFGQSVGLALSLDGLKPVEQWQLLDHFPVSIDRGVVNTELYNDGYWTAVGWQWRLFRDGHDELVLSLEPHDALSTSITADLIPSDPVAPAGPVRVGCGEPEVSDTWGERVYYDRCTGLTWELTDCPDGVAVAHSWVETFTRTMFPFVAQDSEFITDGLTPRWGAPTGPLAAQMGTDGSSAYVYANSSDSDSSRNAVSSIPIFDTALQTPVELLVKWRADCPQVTNALKKGPASVDITVAGRVFSLKVQDILFTGATGYDNGDVLGPGIKTLTINTAIRSYSNTGSTTPLGSGEATFYPDADAEANINARLRVEQDGSDVYLKGKIWFESEAEPNDWDYEATSAGTAVDLTATPLTMTIRPFRNPLSGPETNISRTTYVDRIELVAGETLNYATDLTVDLGSPAVTVRVHDFSYAGNPTVWTATTNEAFQSGGGAQAAASAAIWPLPVDGTDPAANDAYTDRSLTDLWEIEFPEGATVAQMSMEVTSTAFSTADDLPFKVYRVSPALALIDGVDIPPPILVDGDVLFEGVVPAHASGSETRHFTWVGDIVASGTQQFAVVFVAPLPAYAPPPYSSAVLTLDIVSVNYLEGEFEYCWAVRPPVPWVEFDVDQPFPDPGQIVPRRLIAHGDGVTQYFFTVVNGLYDPVTPDPDTVAIPYQPGSPRIDVDGQYQNYAETDATIGEFYLNFPPEADEDVYGEWRRAVNQA